MKPSRWTRPQTTADISVALVSQCGKASIVASALTWRWSLSPKVHLLHVTNPFTRLDAPNMRLRLTVQRNTLPATNILWNVPETNSNQAYTITRLLEDVNRIIPLEADQWGLEQYVVEVGGFECLHFMPVIQALKEDDHVSIRPLMTAEVRARTLTGRHQISNAGQHLIDGVPFGRPYLKHPRRPGVQIPPRKRQRLEDANNVEDGDLGSNLLQLMPEMAPSEDDQAPKTSQSAAEAVENVTLANLLTTWMGDMAPDKDECRQPPVVVKNGTRAPTETGSRRTSKTVQFKDLFEQLPDDSEEDDMDFALGDSEDGFSTNGDSDDDSTSASDTSESDTDTEDELSTSDGSDSDSDSESNSESDSDSDSEASSLPDLLSSKDGTKRENSKPVPKVSEGVAPGGGRSRTKTRNARRTRSNRLRHLKESGELPQEATLADLQKYEEAKSRQAPLASGSSRPMSQATGKRKRIEHEQATEGHVEETTELEQRKQELMARLGGSSSSTIRSTESSHTQMLDENSAEAPAHIEIQQEKEQHSTKSTPTRRMRPDVGAIGRILARQAARPVVKKTNPKPTAEEPQEPEGVSDPEFWKKRINLTAFECWEEEYELSTPPFPFKQHWDPASKAMREKTKKKQKRDKLECPRQPTPVEEDEEEDKIILNYDDTPIVQNADAEIVAAIEDQLRQDVATASQVDFPPLPESLSTLPDLTCSDIKEGAVIVCKFFAVNPVTITPEISDYKTAIVEKEGDSGNGAGTIQLKIAQRDLPKREKRFDGKGNRIYDAADAFLMEDENEEEGLWEGHFTELLEAKLLKAA